MTPEAIAAELARVQRLLSAREGQPAFGQNVIALKARIAELKAMQEKQPNV